MNVVHSVVHRAIIEVNPRHPRNELLRSRFVLSYDAANIDIDALAQALRAGQGRHGIVALRLAVRARVASTRHHGVGGFTTFNGNGDTTNRVISMWRVNGKTGSSFQWLGYVPGFTPR